MTLGAIAARPRLVTEPQLHPFTAEFARQTIQRRRRVCNSAVFADFANAEVTRQAAMVAYVDDFKLLMLIALGSIPLLLLLREARRRLPPATPIATAAADD